MKQCTLADPAISPSDLRRAQPEVIKFCARAEKGGSGGGGCAGGGEGGGQGGSERAYAHTYKANLDLSLEGRFKHEILVRISHESIQRRIYLKYPRPNPISMNINCFSIDEAVGLQSSMTRRGSSLSPSPG